MNFTNTFPTLSKVGPCSFNSSKNFLPTSLVDKSWLSVLSFGGNKEQVILKKYQSINSETISDRVVEPFGFTDNYCTVMAFEPSSLKNKTYNIDRIAAIEFNNQRCLFESDYEQQIPDAFGFSFSGVKHPVHLELPLKQYLLLKNDYPMTTPYFKFNAKKDLYELNIEVNDLGPLERFLRGIVAKY